MSGWRENATTSARDRGYGAEWQALRKQVLKEEPFCRECSAPSTDVDHIIPKAQRSDLFLERANLQGMCSSCHRRKTGRESGRKPRARPRERHPGEIT